MPILVRHKQNNAASFFAPFHPCTSQFGPPTAGEASCWMPVDIEIINASWAADAAPGLGNARTLQFQDGAVVEGSTLALSGANRTAIGDIGAELPAATLATIAGSDIAREIETGTPATVSARIAYFYQDRDDDRGSWYGCGSASVNQVVTTAEYISFWMNRTTASESVTRQIMPVAGIFDLFQIRYGGIDGTTHDFAIVINGVETALGSFTGTTAALNNVALEVPIDPLDEVSFKVVRSGGSGSTCVFTIEARFIPDEP